MGFAVMGNAQEPRTALTSLRARIRALLLPRVSRTARRRAVVDTIPVIRLPIPARVSSI